MTFVVVVSATQKVYETRHSGEDMLEQLAKSVDEILSRGLCLAALVQRLETELEWSNLDTAERAKRANGVPSRLDPRAVSPVERELFRAALGTWTEAQRIDVSWRIECLGVLAWVSGLLDSLPGPEVQVRPSAVGAFAEPASLQGLRQRGILRPLKELADAADQADQYHWNAVNAGPKPSLARSIARERHYAFNWIWDGEEWDDVTTDTLGLKPRPEAPPISLGPNLSFEALEALLPQLPKSGLSNGWAPRAVALLVRTDRVRSLDELKGRFPGLSIELWGAMSEAYLALRERRQLIMPDM